MIYITICDSDRLYIDMLIRCISQLFEKQGYECDFTIYTSGTDYINKGTDKTENLIFISDNLSGVPWLEIADWLYNCGNNKRIIFMAENIEYVFDALKFFPFYFFDKIQLEIELPNIVNEYLRSNKNWLDIVFFSDRGDKYVIPTGEVMYVTCWKHKVIFQCIGNERIEFRGTLKECEKKMNNNCFIKINQGTLINLNFCRAIKDNSCIMKDNALMPISRERRKVTKSIFENFWNHPRN